MPDEEDEELLSRRTAVAAALQEVHGDLFRFLTRRLGDRHDAADVLQEFYVRVLRSFAGLKDDDKLRPWMNRVLQSAVADHYRRRARQSRLEEDYKAEALVEASFPEEEIDLVVCVCLYKLLPTLQDDYAALLWRVDLLGEAREEVRISLGLTESALRVKLHRPRQTLRRRLEQSCDACPDHGFLNCGCGEVEALRRRLDEEKSSGPAETADDGEGAVSEIFALPV